MSRSGWVLNSNSGREFVRWEVSVQQPVRRAQALTCHIHLAGQYIGSSLVTGDRDQRDYELSLHSMGVGVAELKRMCSSIWSWGRLPLAEQTQDGLSVECNVGALHDQSLTLILRGDDRLSGRTAVAKFKYFVGSLSGEFEFVTDHSCLLELVVGIHDTLIRLTK